MHLIKTLTQYYKITLLTLTIFTILFIALKINADQTHPDLDALFEDLRSSEIDTNSTETDIWNAWLYHENPEVTKYMNSALDSLKTGQLRLAIAGFSRVIKLDPEFAEAWNKRATTYYLLGNFGHSIADIVETLRLEPRHFGALCGLAMIQNYMGNKQAAKEALNQAISIHPFMALNSSLRNIKKEIGEEI